MAARIHNFRALKTEGLNMKKILKALAPFLGVLMTPALALADQAMTITTVDSVIYTIRQDVTGFWAYSIVTLAFVAAGVGYAFGEQGGIIKKLGGVVMGGAIAIGAGQLVTTLYVGSGNGALIG
jgi:type IV secretory pathway VirB2 component (pilin)